MADLLDGNSNQDGFEPVAKPEALINAIETLDETRAAHLLEEVKKAIAEKQSAKNIVGTVFKTIGTAVGFLG